MRQGEEGLADEFVQLHGTYELAADMVVQPKKDSVAWTQGTVLSWIMSSQCSHQICTVRLYGASGVSEGFG